jgi:hypothetical protein
VGTLEIPRILFGDQEYQGQYLEGIKNFIWRKTMYSPKIRENLILKIYQVAKARKVSMTTLVNRILERAINERDGFKTERIIAGETHPLLEKDQNVLKHR